ncbi:MAG: TetR/AcrR family transcriptional regulator [Clostridiales bacterium]|nr:TetR/AcrR family transcriptional regulator [Clostridiales bacterium]
MKREERTRITKSKIFLAAIEEFGTNGYAGGSINNICKTGINKGLVYHNYKDKDELYLECVRKSCEDLIEYIINQKADVSFVDYMSARMTFFEENELEAYIFLEARSSPPKHLKNQIQIIYTKLDKLNMAVYEKELSRHELRSGVTREEVINYFAEIQKIYNLNFVSRFSSKMSPHDQLALHEMNIHRMFDLMLYGIAKGGNER